jgi:hypothetical protein
MKTLTERQQGARAKREERLKRLNAKHGEGAYRACIGCHSGIRPWNQGSDHCARCIERDRPY